MANDPTLLTDCECSLPVTELKNCIRFSQFIRFASAEHPGKPHYLGLKLPAVRPLGLSLDEFATAVANRAAIAWKRELTEGFAKRKRRSRAARSRRLFDFAGPGSLDEIPEALERVAAIVKTRFAPGDYAPWRSGRPLVGLCAIYEQCWEVMGYTRGELVASISLAPGEQQVLEYHTWDKSTLKSEEELTEELEQRLSSKLTRRDSQELVSELSTQSGAKLNGQLSLSIPIPLGDIVIPLGLSAGGELSQAINTKLTGSLTSVTERTDEASATLKNQHKVRIEVSRETGRESKQTRTIANTNRCHTLNCHYFEILSNYRLRTHVKRIAPCVLVDIPGATVTRAWVLCHEDILRRVLLDPIFLPGFAAAKLLETADVLETLKPVTAPAAGNEEPDAEPGADAFNSLRKGILDAWDELQDAVDDMESAVKIITRVRVALDEPEKKAEAAEDLADSIFKGFYLALLAANQDAYNAMEMLDSTANAVEAGEALRRMFASVTHRDYQYTVVKSAIAEGLDALGLPSAVVDFLLTIGNLSPIIGIQSFAEMVADDAGLHVAVKAAEDRVKQAASPVPAEAVAAGLENFKPIFPVAGGGKNAFSPLQIAGARVEFARLKCHIADYKTHYLQAIWLQTSPDERAQFLADLDLGPFTTGELLGFVDGKAAYALSRLDLFQDPADSIQVLKDLRDIMDKQTELTIQLPTGGTTLEAFLGCCDGCEDFIQKSRETELRTGEARAEQEEAEAERRRARLNASLPDLAEFVSPSGGSLTVRVEGTGGGE